MGAQNFNFSPKLPQNGAFLGPNFVFVDENFSGKNKIFLQTKNLWGCCPCHDATE